MLIELSLLLIPGVISIIIYRILIKEKLDIYSYVEYYAVFTFLIYFAATSFMYFRKWTDYSIGAIALKEQIKYGAVCLISAAALPVAAWLLKSHRIKFHR